jgi:hypothetical protein
MENSQYKPGDIVVVFGNPLKSERRVGQAKLIQKLSESTNLEQWSVEYLNNEGYFYNALIKKQKNGTNNSSTE